MPRKKKKSLQEPIVLKEDMSLAEPGDYCFFLNYSNKPVFAEIKKVFEENGLTVIQLISQDEFKFMSVPSAICAFNEKELKGKKRAQLCPEVYSAR